MVEFDRAKAEAAIKIAKPRNNKNELAYNAPQRLRLLTAAMPNARDILKVGEEGVEPDFDMHLNLFDERSFVMAEKTIAKFGSFAKRFVITQTMPWFDLQIEFSDKEQAQKAVNYYNRGAR